MPGRRALKKILIANRGEIAVRVIRTLRGLGLRTVAVHSDADAEALHVRMADEAAPLGPPPAPESYLRGDLIIALAKRHGAQGIHPGYGFLSENAAFARAVERAGLVFVGPTPGNMARLGDKRASRDAMQAAGIPPVPGSGKAIHRSRLGKLGKEIGFPLLLKAALGGGGKGIRIVREAKELESAFDAASSEARRSFGSPEVIAEKYLERARHVEVQALGDGKGGIRLHQERDCSTQRRLQKLLEETPSPAVTPALRQKLLLAAGRALAAERYRSAGTLEFLLSEDGELHFLEMNTRIQVEHPVTEMTANVDLVAEQVRIAAGGTLPPWQGDLSTSVAPARGAAIEFRVNAEDPGRDFCPSIGRVTSLRLPSGPWVRADCGIEVGSVITPYYDSLVAKIIAWGEDRAGAIRRLEVALRELDVGGIVTTAPLGLAILRDPAFQDGKNHCQYLAQRIADHDFFPGSPGEADLPLIAAAAAVLALGRSRNGTRPTAAPLRSPWGRVALEETLGRRKGR